MKIGEYELNKIYNEDCYEAIKKIPDKSVDLVYIDIPYLIENSGGSESPLSQRAKRIREVELETIRYGIDYSIFDELCRIMKHIYIYIWCNKEQIVDIMNYFVKEKNCRFNILIWCKTNPTPLTNNTWLPDVEYCLLFKNKEAPRYNEGYELKSKWYISSINKSDKDLFKHPTIKPLELVKRHLLHSTNKDDVVLDCFMGSGTTAVACKELGRNFIGFEIDKNYHRIACDRVNGINANGQTSIFTDFDNLGEKNNEK